MSVVVGLATKASGGAEVEVVFEEGRRRSFRDALSDEQAGIDLTQASNSVMLRRADLTTSQIPQQVTLQLR